MKNTFTCSRPAMAAFLALTVMLLALALHGQQATVQRTAEIADVIVIQPGTMIDASAILADLETAAQVMRHQAKLFPELAKKFTDRADAFEQSAFMVKRRAFPELFPFLNGGEQPESPKP
jgi:hypothetical protein